ncbi:TetR family transcriptional regulator [Glycomyces luteolus]|uniref:TetR family transcriptional regulator n=1 Tax=Glycomyces luteolus TaxID=2670330 RepID=A0A9X3PPY3_9ACTN|nr:TetR family transcriptional regulator [Glycomyces luteolus]MDA1362975.1 TetR family transcriptional regulator [Glycomyces luteolus]
MPRGVAIPELRQQLFTAAERVILRDGPGKLSGRAVTTEAAVAAGLLYAHFTDLDDFLAAYAVDRSFVVIAAAGALADRAGTGDIAANLADTLLAIPRDTLAALARLLVLRPEPAQRIHDVLGDDTALDAIERAAAAYLEAEHRLGRLASTVDPPAVALALTGTLHHLVLTAEDLDERLRPAITALVGTTANERSRNGG